MWWQLMQQNVQKSSRTILPRSSVSVIGPLLIQPTPPFKLERPLVVRYELHAGIRSGDGVGEQGRSPPVGSLPDQGRR